MRHCKCVGVLVIAVATLSGCTSQAPAPSTAATSSHTSAVPTASQTSDRLASPSVVGTFVVDESGRSLAMECWGSRDPTVFIESGEGAIDEFRGSALVEALASQGRVCLYNRAGRPPSDPPPDRPREAEDVAGDFKALTTEAGIEPPFVLFGRSFGGMVVTFYASAHPEDVAGVVVFDSPAPAADMTEADFPEGVWNRNVEHLNVLTGYENRFGLNPVRFDAQLILISPTHGESTPDDQYWLQTSDASEQVVLEGGTEVFETQAEAIATLILSFGQ